MNIYFGDLHNHCGITYGFGSLENAIKRAKSQLDFAAFIGHAMWPDMYKKTVETEFIVDFHEKGFAKLNKNWKKIEKKIAEANSDDFVTFQGYELHSSKYGDYHLISSSDELPLIYRNSPSELIRDCNVEAIAIPHHIGYKLGYRGINWDEYNSEISPVVEVFSKHGSSMCEYADYPYYHDMGPRDTRNMVYEGLKRGQRFGFVASTDHHAGFPGSYGDGIVAVICDKKTREDIWNAIVNRRTYALTGDKILCDFRINNEIMGSCIKSDKRKIKAVVETEDRLDKIVIYKNLKALKVLNGEFIDKVNDEGCYKIRLEMGWGTRYLYHWNGEIEAENGQIVSYNTYFRGMNVLSPTQDPEYDKDNINNIHTESEIIDNKLIFQCDTVGNQSTLHPSTSQILIKVKGNLDTILHFHINDKEYTASIGKLITYGHTEHMKYYHSQAFKIYRALPETQYKFDINIEDNEVENECDVYHMEVKQCNRQIAYVSPIYVSKNE